MPYLNIGGIGMLVGSSGQISIEQFPLLGALRLFAPYNNAELLRVEAPTDGWTVETVTRELESARYYAESFAPVDAFVGDHWIGSTEV